MCIYTGGLGALDKGTRTPHFIPTFILGKHLEKLVAISIMVANKKGRKVYFEAKGPFLSFAVTTEQMYDLGLQKHL